MPKKYLYNTEKNAYVEITDENKSLVKEKYAANPDIYKIYETEEPPVEEQEGGEPINFTEGSVEQQEQPTEPLKQDGTPSPLIEKGLPVGVASTAKLEDQESKLKEGVYSQVNRVAESDATQVTDPVIPKGISLKPTRFIEEDSKKAQSQKNQFDAVLKRNEESYDKILADGEAAGVVNYNKDGTPVVSDQLFIDELENVKKSSTQTIEAYNNFIKQSYIPAMQEKAKLDAVMFYNEQKDKGGFMAITNQNLFKGIGNIAEGAIDATYEVAVLPFVQQIADDPKKINESVKVFGENVGKLPLLMWSALNGRDDIVGKEPTMVSLSKMAAGFPMADPRLVSEEYEKDFTSSMLGEAYTGVIQSTPAMLSPFRKAAFFSQMYQAAGEEIDNKDLSQNSKTAYKLTSSLVNSALEEFGFRNLLSNKAVTAKIINNVISKSAGQKLGADAIRKLAKYETKTVAENYAKNVAGSYLAEAETGGLQSVFTNTLDETVNLLKGEEVFDSKTFGEIVGDFFYDANMEGIGGLMMGAPISIATSRKTTGTDNLNDVQFAAMEQAIANKGLTRQYLTNLEKSGKITREELDQASVIADEFEMIVGRMPKNMPTDKKRKVYNLLLDRAKIEEENKQLDPIFQKSNKAKVDEIDEKITDITEGTTEEVIEEQEYNQFVDEGVVSEERIQDIANKVRQQQELTPREQEIFTDKTSEVNQKIAEFTPTEEVSETVQAISPLPEGLKNARVARVGGTFDKGARGEKINEKEIEEAQSVLMDELNEIENSNLPQQQKDAASAEVEKLFNELENYEFTTETKTRKITQKRPTRVVREGVKEQTKSPQERSIGRKINRVEGTEFTQEGFVPQEGGTIVLEEQDGKIVLQDFDKDGNRTTAQELELESVNDLELVETLKDDDGKVIGATVRNKNNDAEVFSIMDEELALDYAIEKTKAEVGEMNTEEESVFKEYEEVKKIPSTKKPIKKTPKEKTTEETTTEVVTEEKTTEESKSEPKEATKTDRKITEEEKSALDDILGIGGPKKSIYTENKSEADTRRLKRVDAALNKIQDSFQKIFPNLYIGIAEDSDMFAKFAKEQKTSKESRSKGVFTPIEIEGEPKRYGIILNPDFADVTTAFHEAFHALMKVNGFNNEQARAVTSRMIKSVQKGATPGLNESLEIFVSQYKTLEQSEEYMSELFGILAYNYSKQSGTVKGIIKRWLRKLAEILGLKPKNTLLSSVGLSDSDAATVNMLNVLADKMSRGKVLSKEDVTALRMGGPLTVQQVAADMRMDEDQDGIKKSKTQPKIDISRVRSKYRPGKRVSKGVSVKGTKDSKTITETEGLSTAYVKKEAPEAFIKNANILAKEDIVSGKKKFGEIKTEAQAQEVYDIFTREVANNLIFLTEKFNQNYKDISTLWYDGANILAQDLSKKYDVSVEQVAGMIASLSPQKDWYQNVRLAELTLIAYKDNPVMTQDMVDFQQKVSDTGLNGPKGVRTRYEKSRTKKNKEELDKKLSQVQKVQDALTSLIGTKIKDADPAYQAYYVRLYTELNVTKDYNILRPDGEVMQVATKKDGTKSKVAWGSYVEIGKAVSMYNNGSQENITKTLGEMHKIRNFYNNIIDPMSKDGDVTIDTHAVAAGLLKPLSGNSREVGNNFGTGTSNSGAKGVKGVYYAYLDAYALAAKELDLLPRQVQSITWEAVRGLYTDSFKRDSKKTKSIEEIWERYRDGKITINEARDEAIKKGGGINNPTWAESVSEGVDKPISDIGRGSDSTVRSIVGRDNRGGITPETESIKKSKRQPREQKITESSEKLSKATNLPDNPPNTKNKYGVITSGKVHLYHSTSGLENLNNIKENGIDFSKQKKVEGLFFSKLNSPYRLNDSFVIIETDVNNIPHGSRTEGSEVALGKLDDYKVVYTSEYSPTDIRTIEFIQKMIKRPNGIENFKKGAASIIKVNKNKPLANLLQEVLNILNESPAPQTREQLAGESDFVKKRKKKAIESFYEGQEDINTKEKDGELDMEDAEKATQKLLINSLHEYFGNKYFKLNGKSVRIADHAQGTIQHSPSDFSFVVKTSFTKNTGIDDTIGYYEDIQDAIDIILDRVGDAEGETIKFSKRQPEENKKLKDAIEFAKDNNIPLKELNDYLLNNGYTQQEIDEATPVESKPKESIQKLINKISRLTDNNEARAIVAKELRELLKDSKLSQFSKRTINKVITSLKNTNVSNMQKMLDKVEDAISDDEGRVERIKRYKDRSRAIKRIANIGPLKELQDSLVQMLGIDPKYLSEDARKEYDTIISDILNINRKYDKTSRDTFKAKIDLVLNSYNIDSLRAKAIADRINELIDTTKTLNTNLARLEKDGYITKEERGLITRFKSLLDESSVADPMAGYTEEEIELYKEMIKAEKREAIEQDFIETLSQPQSAFYSADDAGAFKLSEEERRYIKEANSITLKDIQELSLSDAKSLVRALEAMKAGFLVPGLFQGVIKVRGVRGNMSIPLTEIKESGFIDKISSKISSSILNRGRKKKITGIGDRLRSAPTKNYEQVLKTEKELLSDGSKRFKATNIYNSLFKPTSSAFSKSEQTLTKIEDKLKNATALLSRNQNKRFIQKAKVMVFQVQREYDSNIGNKEVNQAKDWINATIKDKDTGYKKNEIKELEKIRDGYLTEGQVDAKKLYDSLTTNEKKHLQMIDEVYEQLTSMARIDANVQGMPFIHRENYIHLPKSGTNTTEISNDLDSLLDSFMNASVKNKAAIQRTGKTHSISFDPVSNVYAAARKIVVGYHMYPVIKSSRIAFSGLKNRAETEFQKDLVNELESIYDKIINSQYKNVTKDKILIDNIINYLTKAGYYSQLGGLVKAASELGVNTIHAVMNHAGGIVDGYATIVGVDTKTIDKALENTTTTQMDRLKKKAKFENKDVESKLMSKEKLFNAEEMTGELAASAKTVGKVAALPFKAVEKLNESLITKPDELVIRPLFVGVFQNKFRQLTGQKLNWEKLANDESYRDRFQEAINQASEEADTAVIDTAASINPFDTIPNNISDPDAGAIKKAMQIINRYMTNFRVFEYYSAVKGVQNLLGKGEISRGAGLMLLASTLTRMAVYRLGIDYAFGLIFSALGMGEDEDEIKKEDLTRSVLSGIVTLAFGRNLGNLSQTVINFGIELANKEFGEGITWESVTKDGKKTEYNPYESMVFSKISVKPSPGQDLLVDAAIGSTGPLAPIIKTTVRGVTLANRSINNERKESRDKNRNELFFKTPFDMAGSAGFIPDYKDLKRINDRYWFGGDRDTKKEVEGKSTGRTVTQSSRSSSTNRTAPKSNRTR